MGGQLDRRGPRWEGCWIGEDLNGRGPRWERT